MNTLILRRKDVEKLTGLSRSTIYLKISNGTFPKPVKLGERSVGWVEHEVEGWLEERISIRNTSEVKNG